jgi:hypothetical protein
MAGDSLLIGVLHTAHGGSCESSGSSDAVAIC